MRMDSNGLAAPGRTAVSANVVGCGVWHAANASGKATGPNILNILEFPKKCLELRADRCPPIQERILRFGRPVGAFQLDAFRRGHGPGNIHWGIQPRGNQRARIGSFKSIAGSCATLFDVLCALAILLGAVIVLATPRDCRDGHICRAMHFPSRYSYRPMMRRHASGLCSESSRDKKCENQGELDDQSQAGNLKTDGAKTYTRGQRAGKSQKRCRICHWCGSLQQNAMQGGLCKPETASIRHDADLWRTNQHLFCGAP